MGTRMDVKMTMKRSSDPIRMIRLGQGDTTIALVSSCRTDLPCPTSRLFVLGLKAGSVSDSPGCQPFSSALMNRMFARSSPTELTLENQNRRMMFVRGLLACPSQGATS